MGDYLPLIQVDAESALRDDSGCQLFHILRPEKGVDVVHLYEVYDSEEAIKLHQNSPHFAHYVKACEALVEERIIQRLERVGP
jgi:autoinducer 2-degrading protein